MKSLAWLVMTVSLCGAAQGQTVYRCGAVFSQVPCGEGQKEVRVQANGSTRGAGYDSRSVDEILRDSDEVRRKLSLKLEDPRPPAEAVITSNIGLCEAAARTVLKDEESARFGKSVRLGPAYDYFLGKTYRAVRYSMKINAKNSYGGYTGEKLWMCVFDETETKLVRVDQVGS